MSDLDTFYLLKEKVLQEYKNSYPYFQGELCNFTSADIQNLIELIQIKTKKTISEKWIYTHLKPKENEKLPRKDTLNILSEFVGLSGWDEFVFHSKPKTKSLKPILVGFIGVLLLALVGFTIYSLTSNQNEKKDFSRKTTVKKEEEKTEIVLIDALSNDTVKENVEVFKIENKEKQKLEVKSGEILITEENKKDTIVVESPFYKQKEVLIQEIKTTEKIELSPDFNAMQIRAFLKSDLKNWKRRQEQLNEMLSNNVETIIMLPNGLGAISLNKEETAQKLSFPTEITKSMEVSEIQQDENNKIQRIILIQK